MFKLCLFLTHEIIVLPPKHHCNFYAEKFAIKMFIFLRMRSTCSTNKIPYLFAANPNAIRLKCISNGIIILKHFGKFKPFMARERAKMQKVETKKTLLGKPKNTVSHLTQIRLKCVGFSFFSAAAENIQMC